jgi:hypothetical protein
MDERYRYCDTVTLHIIQAQINELHQDFPVLDKFRYGQLAQGIGHVIDDRLMMSATREVSAMMRKFTSPRPRVSYAWLSMQVAMEAMELSGWLS